MFLQRVGQRGFHDVLDRRVNGQHHVQAIAGLHVFIAQRDQFALLTIRLRHAPARHAAQRRIQNQFRAIAPDRLRNVVAALLRSHETEHVRRQRAVRIHAQLIIHRIGKNRARAQIPEKGAVGSGQFFLVHAEGKVGHRHLDFLPGFVRNLVLQHDVSVRDCFPLLIFHRAGKQALIQIGFADLQQRCELAGDHGLLAANQDRIGANRFHKNARGEQIAARVENVAAARRAPELALGVLLRLGGQFVVPQHLQLHEAGTQAGERQAQQPQQGQHPFQLQPFGHR